MPNIHALSCAEHAAKRTVFLGKILCRVQTVTWSAATLSVIWPTKKKENIKQVQGKGKKGCLCVTLTKGAGNVQKWLTRQKGMSNLMSVVNGFAGAARNTLLMITFATIK